MSKIISSLLFIGFVYLLANNTYSKEDTNEKSLTQQYIDGLRHGKWGASDPEWVNLEQAKEFFPSAKMIGRLEGDTPTVAVFSEKGPSGGEGLLGYLFVTKNMFC